MTGVIAELSHFTGARDAGGWVELHHGGDLVERHHTGRWLWDADPVDLRMLSHCTGATIDIGCGPGRLTVALAHLGLPALGIDISAEAVRHARARGATALQRDVFTRLPGEGRWRWAVLADGNIGIGGDPVRLLERIGALVVPDGAVAVEVHPEEIDHRGTSRLRLPDDTLGPEFPWAAVGARALTDAAAAAGWQVDLVWRDGERRFVTMRRAHRSPASQPARVRA